MVGFGFTIRSRRQRDARKRAIAETNAFLSWALAGDKPMPRIPRRRVDRGGFADLTRRPGSGRLIASWWAKALERVQDR